MCCKFIVNPRYSASLNMRSLSEISREIHYGTNVSLKMNWNFEEKHFDISCSSGHDSLIGF